MASDTDVKSFLSCAALVSPHTLHLKCLFSYTELTGPSLWFASSLLLQWGLWCIFLKLSKTWCMVPGARGSFARVCFSEHLLSPRKRTILHQIWPWVLYAATIWRSLQICHATSIATDMIRAVGLHLEGWCLLVQLFLHNLPHHLTILIYWVMCGGSYL